MHFPKGNFPSDIFPSGNFPDVKFPKGQLPKCTFSQGKNIWRPESVKTIVDAEKLLTSVQLTQSWIVGKMSEFFDPCGFFEPVELQMKLFSGIRKGKEWDTCVL